MILAPNSSLDGLPMVLCRVDLSIGSLQLSTPAASAADGARHLMGGLAAIEQLPYGSTNAPPVSNLVARAAFAATVGMHMPVPVAAAVASVGGGSLEALGHALPDEALSPAALDAAFHLGAAAAAPLELPETILMVPATIEAFCLRTGQAPPTASSAQRSTSMHRPCACSGR